MAGYDLLPDEKVILQCNGNAYCQKSMGDLTLTDKRLIFVKRGMLFGKVKGVDYYELDQVIITDGEPLIERVKVNLGAYIVRVGFTDRTVDFNIDYASSKSASQWADMIYRVLTGREPPKKNAIAE